jgi:hypothetical protein
MPKATLTFNLPDEKPEFEYAQKGIDYSIVLSEVLEYIRRRLKYEEPNEGETKELEAIRELICQEATERKLDI